MACWSIERNTIMWFKWREPISWWKKMKLERASMQEKKKYPNKNNDKRSAQLWVALALESTIKNYLHAFIICLRVYSIKHYDFYRLLIVPFANLHSLSLRPSCFLFWFSSTILMECSFIRRKSQQQMESNQRQRQCHQFISIYNKRFLIRFVVSTFLWCYRSIVFDIFMQASSNRWCVCVLLWACAICTIRCSFIVFFSLFLSLALEIDNLENGRLHRNLIMRTLRQTIYGGRFESL